MEEREENRRSYGNPGDDVEDRRKTVPAQQDAERSPENQTVEFTKHYEQHAGADLPARNPIPAIQINRNGTFAYLFVDQRKNVGAGADGQDVRVAYLDVEPVDDGPDNQAVQHQVKKTVRNHKRKPMKPVHVLKTFGKVPDQAAVFPRCGLIKAGIKV